MCELNGWCQPKYLSLIRVEHPALFSEVWPRSPPIANKECTLYYVYILSNWNNRVLYIGVTNNLERRLYEHKNKLVDGFTKNYNIDKLVYFEETDDVQSAIAREKQIKGWSRSKKDELIKSLNPTWEDLTQQ